MYRILFLDGFATTKTHYSASSERLASSIKLFLSCLLFYSVCAYFYKHLFSGCLSVQSVTICLISKSPWIALMYFENLTLIEDDTKSGCHHAFREKLHVTCSVSGVRIREGPSTKPRTRWSKAHWLRSRGQAVAASTVWWVFTAMRST